MGMFNVFSLNLGWLADVRQWQKPELRPQQHLGATLLWHWQGSPNLQLELLRRRSSRGKKPEAESREALVLALTAIHDDSVVSQLCDVGSVGCLLDLSWTKLG